MINMTDLDSGSISLVQDYVNELLRSVPSCISHLKTLTDQQYYSWLEQEKPRVFLKDYKQAGTNLNVVKR
jgi:hypothetical protein